MAKTRNHLFPETASIQAHVPVPEDLTVQVVPVWTVKFQAPLFRYGQAFEMRLRNFSGHCSAPLSFQKLVV